MTKEGKSLKRKLLLPLSSILLIQAVLLMLFYQYGGMAQSLEQSAARMLIEDTENNKLNMERELLQHWISGIEDTSTLSNEIEAVLQKEHCTAADIQSNSALNSKIIYSVMEQLINRLRRSYGNGIFLILNGPASEKGVATEQAGVAIRDIDSSSFATDNSDLLLERGNSSLAGNFGMALDTTWDLGFDFAEITDDKFYSVPFAQTESGIVNRDRLEEYAYFGASDLNPKDNIHVLVYSVPLVLADGTPVGVVGLELSERAVRKYLNANVRDNDLEILNLLVQVNEEEKSITPVVTGPAQYTHYFGTTNLSFQESKWEGIYTAKDTAGRTWYGTTAPLNIYGKRVDFEGDRWVWLRLQREKELFYDVNRVRVLLLISTAVSLCAAFGALFFVGNILLSSLTKLRTQVRLVEQNNGIRLSNTGILEIDELVGAINRLNENVRKNSEKISGILELSELEIGMFEEWQDSGTVFCSRSLLKLLELPYGTNLYEFIEKDVFEQFFKKLKNPLQEEKGSVFEFHGKEKLRYIRIRYIQKEDGIKSGVLIDVTEEMNEKKKLEWERNYDFLTGLYNRRAFGDEVRILLEQNKEKSSAMVVWDLDNLKYVNDTYGHETGDRYICLFADCLRTLNGAILERRSGDEFSAFFYQGKEKDILYQIQTFMKEIKDVALTVQGDYQIPLRASAGIAWYPRQAKDFDTLLHYADFAMYMAKHNAKGMTREFELKSYEDNFYLLSGQEELNRILETEDVYFAMQPIVTRGGEIYGYELLMRPNLETLRNISELLQLARIQAKLPQFEALTWNGALEWIERYQEDISSTARFFINSIANVSLSTSVFLELEKRYPELMERLVIEITEQESIEQQCLKYKVDVSHRWNCQIALDDYGSGYSSEGTLLQFEPDIVKMDIILVRDIQNNEKQQVIVKNLIAYCHPQNIMVLAEGVETEEELVCLMELGVDLFQGYYLARPSRKLPTVNQKAVKKMLQIEKADV